MLNRRELLAGSAAGAAALWLAGCGDSDAETDAAEAELVMPDGTWWMPAEEARHDATWMCLPARRDVWGQYLGETQQTIADIALAVAAFEPVRMLVHPDDLDRAFDLMGSDVEQIEAPVDDLWARDTLPLFLTDGAGGLAAGRVRFNGWGGKQVHDGDARLAGIVAEILGVDLVDSGIVGEGGGLEVDGEGTLLAARSSWINDNRNPGWGEGDIGDTLVELLGAERILWVDGIAGQDITDGHIDTLARFTDPATIIHELPSYVEPGETWYDVAVDTADALEGFRTLDGDPYELVTLRQPERIRGSGDDFLASYVNYYVCNDAVLVPEFGDAAADGLAADQIGARYPGREVVVLNIDPVSFGGGGIHCATQQQPAV
ncbi:MAG: agmatine deiminase family protein [Actinomycetota bacterium]